MQRTNDLVHNGVKKNSSVAAVFTVRLHVMQRMIGYCCRNSVRLSVRRVYYDKTK